MVAGQHGEVRVVAGGGPQRFEVGRRDDRQVLRIERRAGQLDDADGRAIAPRGRVLLHVAEPHEGGEGAMGIRLVNAELLGDLRDAHGPMRGYEQLERPQTGRERAALDRPGGPSWSLMQRDCLPWNPLVK